MDTEPIAEAFFHATLGRGLLDEHVLLMKSWPHYWRYAHSINGRFHTARYMFEYTNYFVDRIAIHGVNIRRLGVVSIDVGHVLHRHGGRGDYYYTLPCKLTASATSARLNWTYESRMGTPPALQRLWKHLCWWRRCMYRYS